MMDLSGRHAATEAVARHFEYEHLASERLREVSRACHDLAEKMITMLPDGPELTFGLRELLLAKDAFVRAALDRT